MGAMASVLQHWGVRHSWQEVPLNVQSCTEFENSASRRDMLAFLKITSVKYAPIPKALPGRKCDYFTSDNRNHPNCSLLFAILSPSGTTAKGIGNIWVDRGVLVV